nr:nuclease-related domain-containing protein [Neobacillus sp. Marseille-Q6967]
MSFKPRTESDEMRILRSLNARTDLSAVEKQHYLYLVKGYEGEVVFDEMAHTAGVDSKFYKLDDLQLECNNTSFQIDSLFITQQTIIPCEIKNYEGNYYYEKGNFHYCLNKKMISNPLHQLNRGETLLRQFLQQNGFHIPVEGYLNFVHPAFFLYQSPFNDKIIYPSQHPRFFKELGTRPSKLNDQHRKMADFLVMSHKPVSPYGKLPPYTYEQLRKGIICKCCQSFLIVIKGKTIICSACGAEETVNAAVMRSVEELKLLFPGIKITANTVIEWCNIKEYKRKIRRILLTNYKRIGRGKYTYYTV